MGGFFDALDRLRPYLIWDGAVARAVRGDRLSVAVIELEPNVDVPTHQHENEQVGFVISGSITMSISGESRTLDPGGTYVIPSNVPHKALVGAHGAVVMDAFGPPRADWEELPRGEPGRGAWPS